LTLPWTQTLFKSVADYVKKIIKLPLKGIQLTRFFALRISWQPLIRSVWNLARLLV